MSEIEYVTFERKLTYNMLNTAPQSDTAALEGNRIEIALNRTPRHQVITRPLKRQRCFEAQA